MKTNILTLLAAALLCAALLAAPACAQAQRIDMPQAFLSFEYPDSWLVLSPQLAMVYEPLLAQAGIDAYAFSQEMEQQGVQSRAYNADFSQSLSIITRSDETSMEIFQMENVTDDQRKTLRRRAENGTFFGVTGLRVQDVEWQKEGGIYWLYIHYTKTHADKVVGRGLRYVTVRNGMYVMIDWQISTGRFGNRDLNAFRNRIGDLTVTEMIDVPVRPVPLTATIPAETSTSELEISGTTLAGAGLVAEAPDADGVMRVLSVGTAGSSGEFTLIVPLEEEGVYDLTLTATAEGRSDTTMSGSVSYSAKTLPVSLDGLSDGAELIVTQNTFTLSGSTLSGVQMQLVTPYGMTRKRAGNDGSFSFELTTKDAGIYRYTLILDKGGFNQRRIQFTLTRVMTDDQEHARIKENADSLSYRELQKDKAENRGKILSVYGPVVRVSEGGGMHYVRMHYSKNADGWHNEIVIVAQEDMGVRPGDMLSVVATVGGVFEEQDAKGNDVLIPRLDLMFVDKVE